ERDQDLLDDRALADDDLADLGEDRVARLLELRDAFGRELARGHVRDRRALDLEAELAAPDRDRVAVRELFRRRELAVDLDAVLAHVRDDPRAVRADELGVDARDVGLLQAHGALARAADRDDFVAEREGRALGDAFDDRELFHDRSPWASLQWVSEKRMMFVPSLSAS